MSKGNRALIERQTFPQMFDRSILKYGDRICQRWKDGPDSVAELSYAQVGRLVMELSAGLMSMGVEKGDRVAIMSVNCPQWLWADFSILNAGGVTVAVYPSLSQREMANIINDAGVKVLYVDGADNLQKVINLSSEMSALHKVIVFNHECLGDDDADIISLDELRGKGREWLVRRPFDYERRWRSVDLFDNMTIIYTSGTTGKHKGAVHTHFSMNAACALDLLSMPPITEEDVFLSVLSLSHSYERQCGQMMALLTGAAIAYAQSPFTLMEDIALFRPTLFMATPSHLEVIYAAIHAKLAADAQSQAKFEEALNAGLAVIEARTDRHGFVDMSEDIDFTAGLHDDLKQDYRRADTEVFSQARALLGGRFRFAFSAAGGLPARLARIFMALGIRIIEGYGLIETCNTVTLNRLPKILPGSVGPLAYGMEGRIAEDGEWLVRGDNIIKGYWNNPEANDEAFTADGFFKTGDIVQEMADGYMKIVDRKKGLLVLNNGIKTPAAKIESAFLLNEYIEQVCAVGDDYPYVTVLVVPKFDVFISIYEEQGIAYDSSALQFSGDGQRRNCIKVGPDFVAQETLKKLIDQEIHKVNQQFEDYEAIHGYHIVNRRFTASADEITPTLKLKRKVIYQNFAAEIEQLYREDGQQGSDRR